MKKKNFYGWLAMATMLVGTGCSTDEVVNDYSEGNAIQFGTYVGRNAVSRGSVITAEGSTASDDGTIATDALKTLGFGVFAYYTDDADFVADVTDGSPINFMYNQQVKVENDANAYSYSPLKYWPNESTDKLSFFAYAPHQATTVNDGNFTLPANSSTGRPTLTFKINEDVKKQQDLLWAPAKLNLTKYDKDNSVNALVDIDDKVTFEFKHALARIGFDVQTVIDKVNADDAEGQNKEDDEETGDAPNKTPANGENLANETTVVVKKVTLKGYFDTTGTLTWDDDGNAQITASSAATAQTTFVLDISSDEEEATSDFKSETEVKIPETVDEDKSQYVQKGQSVNQNEAQLNADDSYIMIIPKEFKDNDKLEIYVEYDVVTEDPSLSDGYSKVVNKITSSFTGINFEAGKAYKFSLHLGLTSVKLNATVADWVTASTNPETDYAVNVPLNIEDDDDTSNP